ncbi:hypothetical protein C8J57DRAFT_1086881 [Mycena rebaudengoi]|nr:hypothetical protein C8J57DRAFT_1086881 [Mycena rebaudengoi]
MLYSLLPPNCALKNVYPRRALSENQLKLHIMHMLGPPPEREKYSSPIITLEMTEFTAENWFEVRQSSDKWITKCSRDEEMNKNRKKKAATQPHDGERRGPKRLYDWTEKWLCGHSGKYRDERDHNLSLLCGEDRVKIEYCWEHDGHEPGTIKDMAGSMLPLRVKEWIENPVADGLNWKAIKPLLRLDFPESLRITQADVYNALRRRLSKLAHLDPDGRRSLELWNEKFEMLGYSVLYQPNLATGKGCPAAFMITPSEAQYVITDFIRWLRVECKFICSVRMIDCSEVEAAGITFGCGFAILLFLCFWHVMKAVAEQAKKSSGWEPPPGVSKVAANSQLRAEAVADFRRLLNAITTVDFDEILNETHVTYSEHPDWLKYLNTQWLPKKHRWEMAYRQDTPHHEIDTNNYVESWHHHLKSFCLKLMQKQRVDVLLHILTEQVEPDFRRSDIHITLDFERPWLSKSELASQQKAISIPTEDLDDMIDYAGPEDNETSKNPNIYIHTFMQAHVFLYDFPSADNDFDTLTGIISCECPEFMKHELKCKHMFLASRITGYPVQHLIPNVATQVAVQSPPANSVPSDVVAVEKQATVRSIQDEISTISRLSQTLSTMNLGDSDRVTLVAVDVQATRLRKDLSAAVDGRLMHSTQLN